MEFKTKFHLNDEVYIITKHMTYKMEICETCNNTGYVQIKDKTFKCPDCGGYTRRIQDSMKWELFEIPSGKIGKIIIESYANQYCKKDYHKQLTIKYMLDSTGVGSGTLWEEDNLCTSYEEAIKECKERNEL